MSTTKKRLKSTLGTVFQSEKDVPLVWLLLQGQLPPIIFSEQRFFHLSSVVQSVVYLSEKGEAAPFDAKRVWAIARDKYAASEQIKELLQTTYMYTPDTPILSVIKERLLYEKVLDLVSTQIQTGAYNPLSITRLLDEHAGSSQVPLTRLGKPTSQEKKYNIRSGIRVLDDAIGGFGDELVIVAAPPKHGKSNFFINITARQPVVIDIVYITIADYGEEDLNYLIQIARPGLFAQKENFWISDMTGFGATVLDVEAVVKKVKREGKPLLVVVDRAEKLKPLVRYEREAREHDEIFATLRLIAKRYQCTVLTDSQYGSAGQDFTRKEGIISSEFLYGDRTIRQSNMDLFIGVLRQDKFVTLCIEGRRVGKTPCTVDVQTTELGVYK